MDDETQKADIIVDIIVSYKRGDISLDSASQQIAAQTGVFTELAKAILRSVTKNNILPFKKLGE